MKRIVTLAASAAALALAASAHAATIPDGTFAIAANFVPTITFVTSGGTFNAANGTTFDMGGTGFFANVGAGAINGALSFSSVEQTTLAEPLSNFFTFSNAGSTYTFSASSVQTTAFSNTGTGAGGSRSATLLLLGTTIGGIYSATPSSLTLSFNSTGGSAFSSSASFALPAGATTAVPEPATWALFAGAFGVMGAGLRRRRTAVTFA